MNLFLYFKKITTSVGLFRRVGGKGGTKRWLLSPQKKMSPPLHKKGLVITTLNPLRAWQRYTTIGNFQDHIYWRPYHQICSGKDMVHNISKKRDIKKSHISPPPRLTKHMDRSKSWSTSHNFFRLLRADAHGNATLFFPPFCHIPSHSFAGFCELLPNGYVHHPFLYIQQIRHNMLCCEGKGTVHPFL